jgi:excisionase family DNA binding protein
MEKMYNIKEVAEFMGISAKTVERLLWAGLLKSVKWGKAHRIKQSDIEELMMTGWKMPKEARAKR